MRLMGVNADGDDDINVVLKSLTPSDINERVRSCCTLLGGQFTPTLYQVVNSFHTHYNEQAMYIYSIVVR